MVAWIKMVEIGMQKTEQIQSVFWTHNWWTYFVSIKKIQELV